MTDDLAKLYAGHDGALRDELTRMDDFHKPPSRRLHTSRSAVEHYAQRLDQRGRKLNLVDRHAVPLELSDDLTQRRVGPS